MQASHLDPRRRMGALLPAAALALLLAACSGGPAAAAPTREPVKVSVPYTPLAASSLPLWNAAEEGRFAKHGLDVSLEYVGGASAIIQAMVGGQWDVGIISGGDAALNRLQGGEMLLVGAFVSSF